MKRLDDPTNMLGANYSMTKEAFRDNPNVIFSVPGQQADVTFKLNNLKTEVKVKVKVEQRVREAVKVVCERLKMSGASEKVYKPCSDI